MIMPIARLSAMKFLDIKSPQEFLIAQCQGKAKAFEANEEFVAGVVWIFWKFSRIAFYLEQDM